MYVLSAYNQPANIPNASWQSSDTTSRLTFKNGDIYFKCTYAMNGGIGQDTSKKPTADVYCYVHNHALNQFYLGRQGATDFHPKPRKEEPGS